MTSSESKGRISLILSYLCVLGYLIWFGYCYHDMHTHGGDAVVLLNILRLVFGSGIGLLGLIFVAMHMVRRSDWGIGAIIAALLNVLVLMAPQILNFLAHL